MQFSKSCLRFVFMLGLLIGAPLSAEAEPADDTKLAKPTVTTDGRVASGSKSLWQKNDWAHVVLCLDNDAICNFGEYLVWESGHMSPVFLIDRDTRVEDGAQIFEGGLRNSLDSDVQFGEYRMETRLRDDDLVEVHATIKFDSKESEKELKKRYGVFSLPEYLDITAEVVRDGKTRAFAGADRELFEGDQLKDVEFRFFPGEPRRSFRMIPLAMGSLKIEKNRMLIDPTEAGEVHFLLDIREPAGLSGDDTNVAPNGIDFVALDDLHLPDYSVSRNMLRNPSFEAGFRYWGMPIYCHSMIPLSYTDVFTIDDEVAHSGNKSMKMRAIEPQSPIVVGTMALPLIADQPYTVSFYAKSSAKQGASVRMWGRGLYNQLIEPSNRGVFFVNDEWKRYEVTFTPKEKFGALFFYAQGNPELDDKAVVWVDDVQIEQGEMTDFVQPPVVAALNSSARGNFLEFGQAPNFELEIEGPANATGTAEVSVQDFFFKNIYKTTLAVELDSQGRATLEMDELSGKLTSEGLRGVWVARVGYDLEGLEEPFVDHYRFSVMNFLKNEHEHNDLFNLMWTYALQMGGPEAERFVQREQAIGFGSYTYDFIHFAKDSPLDLDRERAELAAKYGFESTGRPIVAIHVEGNGVISEQGEPNRMENIRARVDPTEEELKEFEAIAELKARNRPWNDIWWFSGESNPGMMPLVANRDAFAKWLLATSRGIKRGNPDAKVLITGGPWNIAPDSGTKWVEEYIQDTKRLDPSVTFDGAAGHHYRNFPENPDLDDEIGTFIEMLDRNGHPDWPVYINEGGHYLPFNVPQLGISPYIAHSGNAWYIGPLSYDVGKSERISAAFTARNWLIGLKYADRVECMHDFNNPARYVDFDFTSRPYDKIPNTLGRLLGNSRFERDLRFAPMVRCYVFTDKPTGEPIAAIWGHDEGVDRFKEDPPRYSFDFSGIEVTAIDLMENEVELEQTADGKTIVAMSPFPMFLRADEGQLDALAQAISKGTPVSGGTTPLQFAIYPASENQAVLTIQSTVDRPLDAKGTVTVNGETQPLSAEVAGRATTEQKVTLSSKPKPGQLPRLDWQVSLDGEVAAQNVGSYLVLGYGKSDQPIDWEKQPGYAAGQDVELRGTVRGNQLHLLLRSTEKIDRDRPAIDRFSGVGLYIDPFLRPTELGAVKTVRSDLAVYELVNMEPGKLGAMCRYVQGTAAGSGTDFLVANRVQKDIKVIDRTENDLAAVELVFPEAVLSPLQIKPGSMVGLNVYSKSPDGKTASLAPLSGFKSVTEPGDIELVMGIIER